LAVKSRSNLIAATILLFSFSSASALWMRIETERVPIDRVLTNLRNRLATNTQSVEALYQLGRVYSMAYATNLTEVPVTKEKANPMFYHPGSDSGVPRQIFPRSTPQAQAEARRHLTNAIGYYERAARLVMKGTNSSEHRWLVVPIHLGLAWCLDQAGRRDEAIDAYRDALHHAWRQEVIGEYTLSERARWSWDRLRAGQNPLAKPKRVSIGPEVCFSEEIIGYLLALLDPVKDAKEIAQLKADRKELRSMGRMVTPVLVPLKADLPLDTLVRADAGVAFDLDGTGDQRRWGWITTNAAWLVFDHDGNGRITSGLQLFGNATFWIFWRDGYEALASLDDDGNGELSGPELHGVALWHDRNSNGISEAGEVTPVEAKGIKTIHYHSAEHSSGIPFCERGVVFRDGTVRATYDWISPSR
jgi:hypothetical protein